MNMPLQDAREAPQERDPGIGRSLLDPATLKLLGSFAAGLLLGWWLLGWWIFPVQWGPASPAHLDPSSRDDYLQLVADSYNQSSDLVRTRAYLEDLDALQIGTSLRRLSRSGEAGAAHAQDLAGALAIDLDAADLAAAEAAESQAASEAEPGPALSPPAGSTERADTGEPRDWQTIWRWVFILALIGALGAGLLLAWSWWRWRSGAQGANRAETRPSAAPIGVPGAERIPHAAPSAAPTRPAPRAQTVSPEVQAEDPGLESTQAMPSVSATRIPSPEPSVPKPPVTRRGRGSASGPAWQPERIEIGQTVDARYHSEDQQSIHTWLVYDSRGALVGGAGLMAQSIGGVNTLDLWFSDREDVDQTTRTPTVTFVTQRAYDDPVLRARLSDRRLVPAIPGRSTRLETVDLMLDIEVIAVEPVAESHPGLQALVLALTAYTQPGTGLHRAVAASSRFEDDRALPDAQAPDDWSELLDEEIDEAFDPPRPMHFRRDE